MKIWNAIARGIAAAATLLACAAAPATPVTLTLQGTVAGYEFTDLGAIGLTMGSAVNLSLTFNETWSDSTYSFADPLGPVSGSMTVGSFSYSFNDAQPFVYAADGLTGATAWVEPQFLGSGPTLGGADFFGLFASFTPGLALANDLLLGYGFTTTYNDGFTITNYGYARITADSYSITPAGGTVPAPASLTLVMTALLAAGWTTRRRA